MSKRSTFTGPTQCGGWKIWLTSLVLFACFAVPAKPEIALLDTGSLTLVARGASTTTFSEPMTVSAGAKVLVVCVNDHNQQNATPATLTWQGQTVTRAVRRDNSAGTWRSSSIFYLWDPSPGSGFITGTFSATIGNYWVSAYTLTGVDTAIAPLTGSANSGAANTVSFTINDVPEGGWVASAATYANSGGYVSFSLYATNAGASSGAITQNAINGAANSPNMAAYGSELRAGPTTFYATEVGTTLNQKMSFVAAVFTPIFVLPPTGVTAVGGISQIALSWTVAADATNYVVYRSTTSGGGYAPVATTSETSYTDIDVASGTTYYYVVRTQAPRGESANSSQASAITVPDAPTTLAALPQNLQVTLAWPASVGASEYVVSRSTTSGTGYEPVGTTASTFFVDTPVANLTPYFYVVVARNASGDSAATSPEATATPNIAPANLAATASSGQIALMWDPLAGAISYTVKRAPTSNGPFTTLATGLGAPSYTDSGLGDGFTYFYVVSAQLGGGESAYSLETSATTPFLAISLTATPASISQIDLTWTSAGTGVTLYKVEGSTDAVNFAELATVTGLTFADTGRTAATKYFYRVRAFNGLTHSPYSDPAEAITHTLIPINFALASYVYPGYLPDYSYVYGDRGNGFSYGWDYDNTANARNRNLGSSPDMRYATFTHMQKQTPSRVWRIELPYGDYTVHSVGGEPDNYDSTIQFILNDVTTPWVAGTSTARWVEFTNTVTVSDGFLTVNSGPNATNNKLAYMDIVCPSVPPYLVSEFENQTLVEDSGPTYLSVLAGGAPPLRYQWYFNDSPLEGQTNKTMRFDLVRLADAGSYYVVITNAWGAYTTRMATVTVDPDVTPPTIVSVSQDLGVGTANRVQVVFSEAVNPETAQNPVLYVLDLPFNVLLAEMIDSRTVVLTFDSPLPAGTAFTLSVSDIQDMAETPNIMDPVTISAATWSLSIQRSTVRVLTYTNLNGATALNDLFVASKFVDNNPDVVDYLPTVDWPKGSAMTDIADHTAYNYGIRISGYLMPATTANYTFRILSDDEGRFLLSTDADPAHMRTVVRYADGTCCGTGVESAPVPLTGGRAYYMEVLMKQGGGGDGLHIAWKTGTGSYAAIPSANLVFAYRPDYLLNITQDPAPQSLVEGQTASFSLGVFSTELGLTYQWQANGVDIPGATGPTYNPVVTGAMNGSLIRCIVSGRLETGILAVSVPLSVTSQEALLTVLGTPTDLAVVGGVSDMTVTWNPVVFATTYVLSRADNLAGPYTDILVTSETSYLEPGLPAGTVFYYRVAAQGELGQSAWSTPVVGYTLPPMTLGLLALPGDTQVTLNWTVAAGTLSYNVKRADVSGGPYTAIGNVTGLSFIDTGLVNGSQNYYVVAAVNGAGEGPFSSEVLGVPGAAPAGFTATGGTNVIYLQWTALPGAASYNIKRAEVSGGPYTTIASGVATASYEDVLPTGVRYYYIVSAQVSSVESANSLEAGALTAPSAPTDFTATLTNYTIAILNWNWSDPTPASSFIIEKSREGAAFEVAGTVDGSARTFTANNLDQSRNYTFRVQAVNPTGFSPYSGTASVKGTYFEARINFGSGSLGQGGVMPDYPDYLRDIGEVFGDRGNGFTYGWSEDNQANARYRTGANYSPDLRYSTLNHLQKTTPGPFWEITLPPGEYRIHIGAGDPDNYNSTFSFDVEGNQTAIIPGADTARFADFDIGAYVTDGRLTITNGIGADNNKICYVDILAPIAPEIIGHPQDLSVNEGQPALFTVQTTGSPIYFQWYHNDVPIQGATSSSLYIPYVDCNAAGQYKVSATNTYQSVMSQTATLTVEADVAAPYIVSAGSLDGNTICVQFSEPIYVEAINFKDPYNWEILDENIAANIYFWVTNGTEVTCLMNEYGECIPTYYNYPVAEVLAWPDTNALQTDKVLLKLAGHFTPNISGPFSVQAYYMEDASCARNWSDSFVQSTTIDLTMVDIWQPNPPGSTWVPTASRIEVTAGGYDMWNNGDQFTYLTKQVDGDFDVRVTVLGIPDPPAIPPDAWSKAGIMVRGSITGDDGLGNVNNYSSTATNSLMAYIVTTPTNAGSQHTFASGIRYTNAAPAVDITGAIRPYLYEFPAQIRMVREGSNITTFSWSYLTNTVTDPDTGDPITTLTGYWQTNAVTPTTNWPSLMYLGLATTSHSQNNGVKATYENFVMVGRPSITLQPLGGEVTQDESFTFTVAATGPEEPLAYQWFLNGVAIPGANGAAYTVENAAYESIGSYHVVVRSASGGLAAQSESAQLNVLIRPRITVQPQGQSVPCLGGGALSVTAEGNPGDTFTYQWQLNGVDIPGETGLSLTVSGLSGENAGLYRVLVGNTIGTTASSEVTFTLTDTEEPIIFCDNMNAECGPVTYGVTAFNSCDFPVLVVCTPPSGSVLTVGQHTVTCTANNPQGPSANCSFTVTVVDTTAPTIVCPSNITTEDTTVTWTAPIASDCSAVTVTCSPPSGSTFVVGTTTTVVCTATDAGNLSSTCNFTVTVQPPPTISLSIAKDPSDPAFVIVSWPETAVGFQLETSLTLGPTPAADWQVYTGQTTTDNGVISARIQANGNMFFRLHKPQAP